MEKELGIDKLAEEIKKTAKDYKQAGAELCQAQIRFGLVSIGMA